MKQNVCMSSLKFNVTVFIKFTVTDAVYFDMLWLYVSLTFNILYATYNTVTVHDTHTCVAEHLSREFRETREIRETSRRENFPREFQEIWETSRWENFPREFQEIWETSRRENFPWGFN